VLHYVAAVLSTEPQCCFQLEVKSQCLNENAENGILQFANSMIVFYV